MASPVRSPTGWCAKWSKELRRDSTTAWQEEPANVCKNSMWTEDGNFVWCVSRGAFCFPISWLALRLIFALRPRRDSHGKRVPPKHPSMPFFVPLRAGCDGIPGHAIRACVCKSDATQVVTCPWHLNSTAPFAVLDLLKFCPVKLAADTTSDSAE